MPIRVDNRARLLTTWLREPVPLPEKRSGPALVVLHAGEALPSFSVPVQAVDLRNTPADLVAAYAIFRRYLFDYRTDLATPFWMLIDSAGRVRRIYEDTPAVSAVEADWRAVEGAIPDARALPFDGVFLGKPTRDYFKNWRRHADGGLWRASAPVSRGGSPALSEQRPDATGHRPHPHASQSAGAGAGGVGKRREAGTRSSRGVETILAVSRPRPAIRARPYGCMKRRWRWPPTQLTRW